MIKWSLHIAFICGVFFSFGQELAIDIDREKILIGESFTLTFTLKSKESLDSIDYTAKQELFLGRKNTSPQEEEISTTYELEIVQAFSDTTFQKNDKYIWKGTYRLTAWDSAYVIIPPEEIRIKDSVYYFPAGMIHVNSPQLDNTKPIYDINESFTELPEKNAFLVFINNNWWWIALAAVVLIAVGIYLVKRSRRAPLPLSIRRSTLNQIDELEKSKAYEVDLKEYYFDLSIILRRFFAAHYNIRVMDKTTPEIEKILAENGLDKNMILLTRELLTESDMVKFAQSKPPLSEIQNVTNNARKVVNEITDIELNDE